MKQVAAIVSAIFYLVLSTGVHVHIDTCCDTVENVLMTALPIDPCTADTEELADCGESSCGDHRACPTQELDIQLDEEFLASAPTAVLITLVGEQISTPQKVARDSEHHGDGKNPFNEAPSLPQPIYILHSSLVYYG